MAVVITQDTAANRWLLPTIWHETAPSSIVKKYQAGDSGGGWTAWQNHLQRRKTPKTPPFLAGDPPPLLWFWPNASEFDELVKLIQRPVHFAHAALGELRSQKSELVDVLKFLALAYALPDLVVKMPGESWWKLAMGLHDLADEAQQHRVDWPADAQDVLRQQLLAGELPLVLGYLFPEVTALRELRNRARGTLSEALLELTDGEGLPHGRLLGVFGPLFACWTRARWLGERLTRGSWSRAAEVQYRWLVRHAIRLADADGRFVGSPSEASASVRSKSLFTMALDLAGNKRDRAAAAATFSRHIVPKRRKFKVSRLPKPSLDSDWSGISVLSNGWSHSDVRLAVAYADEPIHIELAAGGERLMAGLWHFETTCDGRPVHVNGEWENLCWQSDKRCHLLELGLQLSNGLRLERQIVLSHKDRVLYMADMVIAADRTARQIRHSVHFPLAPNCHWQPERETRDGLLTRAGMQAAVLPLALPEWRADPRGGTLEEANGQLVLTQESTGCALCCPVFFDFNFKRAGKERTWRQLTVAEWMEIVPRDVAVGFRAQAGRDQWLFYRSLAPAGNRTLLGQNIAGEFTAGRFHSDGEYDEWIEIEAV
jgi:hypothetical protein